VAIPFNEGIVGVGIYWEDSTTILV